MPALASGATVTGWTWQPGGGGGLVVTTSAGGARFFAQLPASLWPAAGGPLGNDEALAAYLGAGSPYATAVRSLFVGSSLSAGAIAELRADPGFAMGAVGAPSLTTAELTTGVVLGQPATYQPLPKPSPAPRKVTQYQPPPVHTYQPARVQVTAKPAARTKPVKGAAKAKPAKSAKGAGKARPVPRVASATKPGTPARAKVAPSLMAVLAGPFHYLQALLGGIAGGVAPLAVPVAAVAGVGIGLGGLFFLVRRGLRAVNGRQGGPVGGAGGTPVPGMPAAGSPSPRFGNPVRPIPGGKADGPPEAAGWFPKTGPAGPAEAAQAPDWGKPGGNLPPASAGGGGGAIEWEIDEDNL